MDNEIDIEELELEQLDYLRRNYDKTMAIPNSVDMNLDILNKPIDDRVMLTPEQEKKLVQEVIRQQRLSSYEKDRGVHNVSFSLTKYFEILSESFVEIMDDILNFDGDLENFPIIFTKGDRLVFVGTVICIICVFLIVSRKSNV
jgi:hypothetical protein